MAGPYVVHPAADLFPMMTDEELTALTEDIKNNGLIDPIILHEGQILDGRNRFRACEIAGVEPRFQRSELNGHSPLLYVVSKNLHRRHLTPSQLACVGADITPLLREEAQKRQEEGGRNGGELAGIGRPKNRLPVNSPEAYSGRIRTRHDENETRSRAAAAVGVGPRLVQDAVTVRKLDPSLYEEVRQGKLAVNAALSIAKARAKTKAREAEPAPTPAPVTTSAPAAKRKRTVTLPRAGKRREQYEHAEKQRMIDMLSRVRGLCRGLERLKQPLLVLDKAEQNLWSGISYECCKKLRAFAQHLKAGLDETSRDQNQAS